MIHSMTTCATHWSKVEAEAQVDVASAQLVIFVDSGTRNRITGA